MYITRTVRQFATGVSSIEMKHGAFRRYVNVRVAEYRIQKVIQATVHLDIKPIQPILGCFFLWPR